MKNIIIEKLKNSDPFALVRFGDGEYIVSNLDHIQLDLVYKIHLGYVPTIEQKISIANGVSLAYDSADYIGIPTIEHTGDIWAITREFFDNIGKNIVSLNIHTELLESFDEIMSNCIKLLYVSGHVINFSKYNLKEVVHLKIPLQASKYQGQSNYYPEIFNSVMSTIQGMDLTGYLVLVGGGFVGKPFLIEAKKRGAVALDMGSTMDRLAGYKIRGKDARYAIVDNKFKL